MQFVCPRCSATVPLEELTTLGEELCGHCGGALEFSPGRVNRWADATVELPGVARYARLLPVTQPERLASSEEALVPLESRALAERLGVARLFLIPQTKNATGTFKDNEGVIVAARCHDIGVSSVCMHSSGNTARAYIHAMGRAGIACATFVPTASAYKVARQDGKYRASLTAVDGGMQQAADASARFAGETGALRLTPSHWKIEGKVPLGLMVAERLNFIDTLAITIASGYGPLGIERGLRRAEASGLPTLSDRSYLMFQVSDAAATARAVLDGAEQVDLSRNVHPDEAFEPTLQSTNPTRTFEQVKGLLQVGNSSLNIVTPDEIEACALLLLTECRNLGVPLDYELEKSAFVAWAGLCSLADRDALDPNRQVALVISGSAPWE
ncbi:pyridoxal-phosphate dependent enzyme [Kribbella sp. NPDC051587]|uniref:threonine synthase n=1 Tax=Kribbella sp. NPDC051587 TaxID=3364119 RepID=UPI0037AEAD24